jgi:cytochrome oxidase Cu insertion factor (SCO1/SenC/PrrC family)
MRPLLLAAVAALVAVAPAASAAPDFEGMRVHPYESPKPAPAFSLPDLDGKVHTLEEARGKVVIVFFWATW